jgi:NAD(P)-dependent dehydrogenase (short-subunit alcohol dehydrogenase family)
MKRAIVTGAASGIGAEVTRQLRAQGVQVVGLDLRPADDEMLACDVRDQDAVDLAVAEAITRLGGLDILVNSAGIGIPQRATDRPGPDALAVLDINLVGTWRVTAAALPALKASRGRVINIASGLAHLTVPLAPAYVMSKRGVVAYSDALRLEVGHAVTVTTVYPGYVRTPIHDASKEAGFGLEGIVPAEPLKPVARRIVGACLGKPVRDLATSPSGTVSYAFLRLAPRGLMDRLVTASLRRQARKGTFDASELASELAQALRGR